MTPAGGDRPTTTPGRSAGPPTSVVVGEDVWAPGVARRAAVLGSPVAYSLSPTLHRAAYAQLGLDDWAYGLQDVTAEQLPAAIAALDESWAGLSLTMPLKVAAAGLVDLTDPVVKVAGVVNTIVVQAGGLLVGANTDVAGITGALADAGLVAGRAGTALVLGARATASSAVAALGGLGVREIVFAARSSGGPGSALPVAHRAGLASSRIDIADADAVAEAALRADVVISTLPKGVADPVAAALRARSGGPGTAADRVLLDVIYGPEPTALAAAWHAAAGTVAEGWGMLLHQAVDQVRLMTGRHPDIAVMREAIREQLSVRATGVPVLHSPPVLPPAR